VKIYGHRGAAGECRENTLDAFAHAKSLGLEGIETDIAITADGVPVLHHDPHLPDGRLIRATARADLPPHIPSLAQGLAAAPALHWLLEIKTDPGQPAASAPPALAAAATIAALRAIPGPRASILAFDWAVLRAVRDFAPDMPLVCLTSPETEAARALWWGPGDKTMSTPDAVAASGADGWAAFHATLTGPQAAAAKRLGLAVYAWTVNDPAESRRLARYVDGVITDHPSRFLQQI
jgi:glycerophosphoryl diester phosphodiesterase